MKRYRGLANGGLIRMRLPARAVIALVAGLGSVSLGSALSYAQPPRPVETPDASPADPEAASSQVAEARALFRSGQEAAEGGLWADAVERFTRSYELVSNPSTLFNLAVALRALGRHAQARDAFKRLLADHDGSLGPERRAEVERLLAAESLRVARLRLVGLERNRRYDITLDDDDRDDTGARPLSFEVDPGPHRLEISAAGVGPYTWSGELVDGQKLDLQPVFAPAPREGDVTRVEEQESSSVFSSPIFWTVVGVVLVGGAIGVGLYATNDDGQLEPMSSRTVNL